MTAIELPRIKLPVVADVEALGSLTEGEIGYDDTENVVKVYDGTSWKPMSLPDPVTDGYLLVVDAASNGKRKWADSGAIVRAKEVWSVYRNAALSLATNGVVTFDTEDADPSSIHDSVTNKGRVTPTRAGWYRVHARLEKSAAASASDKYWRAVIYKNGAAYKYGAQYVEGDATPSISPAATVDGLVYCNGSTDYIEIVVQHNETGSVALGVGTGVCFFDGEFVSADYAGSLTTPKFRGRRTTNDSARATVASNIPFAEDYDSNSNYDGTVFTAPVAGKYHFDVALHGSGAYATSTFVAIVPYKNGAAWGPYFDYHPGRNVADADEWTASWDMSLAAGDTLAIRAYISTGNFTAYGASDVSSYFDGHLIRDDAAVPTSMEAWHSVGGAGEPAFTNSWVNFDATTTPGAQFRKTPWGDVQLRGLIKSGTLGTDAFTLPVGYRPVLSTGEEFMLINSNGTVNDNTARCQIGSDGKVYILDSSNGTGHWVSLAGVWFSVNA